VVGSRDNSARLRDCQLFVSGDVPGAPTWPRPQISRSTPSSPRDEDGDIYTLNPKNGKQLWAETSPGSIQSPAIASEMVSVERQPGPIRGGLLEALDSSDGASSSGAILQVC
jgi:outer membrane protein assembly factor BamB